MTALCPTPATAPRGTLVAVPYGAMRGWQLAVVDSWHSRKRRGGLPEYVRVYKWLESSGRWSAPFRSIPEVCIHLELRFGNMPDTGAPGFPPGPQARERMAWIRQASREAIAEEGGA